MVAAPATLPDLDELDPGALKSLVVDQHAEIEHLKLVIAKLERMYYGRQSEKVARRPADGARDRSSRDRKRRTDPAANESALTEIRASQTAKTAPLSCSFAPRSSYPSPQLHGVPGVRRRVEEAGRRWLRASEDDDYDIVVAQFAL
jgi:hypothetical protein